MTTFKAVVTEDVQANRLLSLNGGNEVPTISITEAGGTPDFRSTGPIDADTEVVVTLKNNTVWNVEAGEDLSAGTNAEVGEDGLLVESESAGIGYVTESVEVGEIAKLVRKASGGSGERGPQGPAGKDGADGKDGEQGPKGEPGADGKDGADGFPTESQWNELEGRVEALEP